MKNAKKRVKRFIIGGVSFLKKEKRVIDTEQIKSVLPHTGRMLLLDRAIFTRKKIIGELLMRPEICAGHEIGGKPIIRGVEFGDMAAQLVGLWLVQQTDEYPKLNGKLAPFREVHIKSLGPVFPGDFVTLEIPVREAEENEPEKKNPKIVVIEDEIRPERSIRRAVAVDGEVWVSGQKQKKAVIYFVELNIVDAESLAE